MSDDYTPIPCSTYSEYELCIIQGCKLRVYWHDTGGLDHCETLQPQDLLTQSGAEFMVARNSNDETTRIRLDHIVKAEEV